MAEVVRITDPKNVTRSLFYCTGCKATCEPKDRGRFKKRHPDLCGPAKAERTAFTKQLAQGTRCVDSEDRHYERWHQLREEHEHGR